MFTSLPGMTITFRTVLPVVYCLTFSSARARASMSSLEMSLATVSFALSLPFTWMTTVTSDSMRNSSLNDGHARSLRILPAEHFADGQASPRCWWISSVMCGANGLRHFRKSRRRMAGILSALVKALVQIIICEIAVLKLIFSMSSLTFLMVSWVTLRSDLSVGSSLVILSEMTQTPSSSWVMATRQTLARKRDTPSTPFICHGLTWVSGPMNIS